MTRSLGPALTEALVARFSQGDLAARLGVALPFVTVDADGRPHPMLLSYLEVKAYDPRTMGLVVGPRSRSAENLVERGTGTLLVLEPDATVYVKLRAVDGPLLTESDAENGFAYFLTEVQEVLEDAASDREGEGRITTPIHYAPTPVLDGPWARAAVAALAIPRARA